MQETVIATIIRHNINLQAQFRKLFVALRAHHHTRTLKRTDGSCTNKWYNQTLCQVNNSVLRLGVFEGEYHWHKHDSDDEFFYVVEGKLLIDLKERMIELAPRQGIVVPKGVLHRTRAPKRTVALMVETAAVVPTGD